MKIANIIHEKELVNHTKAEYVNYINKPTAYEDLDTTLPTLYVGWSLMKDSNPKNELIQNADILKKKIVSNELYWECSFEESKASHVKGVDNFVKHVPEFYFVPKYTYINLDPVFFMLKDLQDLLDVVPKKIDSMYQYKDEMIYLLVDNKITGINLKMYEFFQFKVNDITHKLGERLKIGSEFITDSDGEMYQSQYKIFPNYTHLKRYLIVILSK